MRVIRTAIADVLLVEPTVVPDARGFFLEAFSARAFREATGLSPAFVQDNQSRSHRGVLRGLHYQVRQPQAKLVRVVAGSIWDVVVDLRRRSPTFGRWLGFEVSADNRHAVWIPEGFAHGFLVLSDRADVIYKTTDDYAPEHERTIRWDDPDLAIDWPLSSPPITSTRDAEGMRFKDADVFD
jgi:dTDP-4-dehydrorhamnose 3,5-epimerase